MRYVNPVTQYLDSQGDLLVEGFLRFDESGTNTLKPVYYDADLKIEAPNPVPLDGAGRIPSLFLSGVYKVTAYKNDGIGGVGEQQWSRDPVSSDMEGFGSEWNQAVTYDLGDVTQGSDGDYYISIISANIGNNPTTTASAWSRINLIVDWNTEQTYGAKDLVKGSDGIIYYSVAGSNKGNDPVGDAVNWGIMVPDGGITTVKLADDSVNAAKIDGSDGSAIRAKLELVSSVPKELWPTIANGTDADHDIDFSAGTVHDSTASNLLTLTAMTKQLDAAWAAGDAAGGLFSGSLAADTTYHCFVIRKDSDGSIDAGFDTSVSAANIPPGYSAHKRIGSFITDGSADIIKFIQVGDYFTHSAMRQILNTATPGTSGVLLYADVPTGLATITGYFSVLLNHTALARALFTSPAQDDVAPSTAATDLTVNNALEMSHKYVPVNSSGQIRYRSSVGTVSGFSIRSVGWIDPRID
jgi:hypothetical protein